MNAKGESPSERVGNGVVGATEGDRQAQQPQSGSADARSNEIFVTERIRVPLAEITFTFVRSGGPGGQNVNKVNTKAVMRWTFERSSLPESVRERFRQTFRSRITREGDLVLSSQRYRDQARNREDCLDKLRLLLLSVAHQPKRRRATRPTASSRRRRRKDKELQSQKKKLRKSPSSDD